MEEKKEGVSLIYINHKIEKPRELNLINNSFHKMKILLCFFLSKDELLMKKKQKKNIKNILQTN